MTPTLLFIFGLIIGSFLNVLIVRYDPGKRILRWGVLGGRSRCMQCLRQLAWYELVPIASFCALRGKCKTCGVGISLQYPIVELLSGFIMLLPLYFVKMPLLMVIIWIIALFVFVLIAAIDLRLSVIPDGANIMLALLGVGNIIAHFVYRGSALLPSSFIERYSLLFGMPQSLIASHVVGGVVGMLVFGIIVAATKGKGMGMGDVKLGGALGLLFGYPDIVLIIGLAFTIGAMTGIILMIVSQKKLKDAIPFGPFLVLGATLTMVYGDRIIEWYLQLFGL